MPALTALSPCLRLGGAERSLVRLINALAQHGWSINLIVFTSGPHELLAELRPDVKIHVIGIQRSLNPLLWIIVHRMLRRLKPDIVLGWSTYANLVTCATRWPGDRWRLVLSERNYLPQVFHAKRSGLIRRWFTLGAIKLLYRCADIITANSKANLNFMKHFIGANIAYHYLPNIAGLPQLDKHLTHPQDVPGNLIGPKILALGRIDSQKGFDIALRAMARVRESRPWSLVVVGEGKEREQLHDIAHRLGLSGAVHWLGARIDPRPYYHWSDIVIVPSRFEGFPNVALEAMACGRLVICSDCMTGPKELTDEGKFGILVPPEDSDALAEAILGIGDDPVRYKSIGEAAAQYVADTYSIGAVLPTIENALLKAD